MAVVIDVAQVVDDIDTQLRSRGTRERAEQEKRYLKSDLVHYGTTVPVTRSIAKAVRRQHADLDHDDLVALATALWDEHVHERRTATVEVLGLYADLLRPSDMALLERFLRQSRTWALVDGLAASVVGALVERTPESAAVLDRWAADDDFWIRRSALLALLVPLRKGRGDFDRFARYADAMLGEKEFFIRKAIGWVLRDTAKNRPDMVYEWLLPRASKASGVTLREALKPLSDKQRASVLAAR